MLTCVIVDDSKFIRLVLSNMVKELGHQVIGSYGDGAEFLNDIDVLAADIIFLDMVLPNMSGLEILGKLDENTRVKTVVLSGVSEGQTIRSALELGAIDFITKPINKDQLCTILENLQAETTPKVSDPSLIEIACHFLNGFFSELLAHSISTLYFYANTQISSVLNSHLSKSESLLIIDAKNFTIYPNSQTSSSELEVFGVLSNIVADLFAGLSSKFSESLVQGLFEQTILTMSSKVEYKYLFKLLDAEKLGLPAVPESIEPDVEQIRAATTFSELGNNTSLCVFKISEERADLIINHRPDFISDDACAESRSMYHALLNTGEFDEVLLGPLPIAGTHGPLSSIGYVFKKKSSTNEQDNMILVCLYFTQKAEILVADTNKVLYLMKDQFLSVDYWQDIRSDLLASFLETLIEYSMDDA